MDHGYGPNFRSNAEGAQLVKNNLHQTKDYLTVSKLVRILLDEFF